MSKKRIKSGERSALLLLILVVFTALNVTAFGFGLIDSRNCGFVGNIACKYENDILDRSNWSYVLPGYNLGVRIGVFMNQEK